MEAGAALAEQGPDSPLGAQVAKRLARDPRGRGGGRLEARSWSRVEHESELVKIRTRPPPAVNSGASHGRSRLPLTITINGSCGRPFRSRLERFRNRSPRGRNARRASSQRRSSPHRPWSAARPASACRCRCRSPPSARLGSPAVQGDREVRDHVRAVIRRVSDQIEIAKLVGDRGRSGVGVRRSIARRLPLRARSRPGGRCWRDRRCTHWARRRTMRRGSRRARRRRWREG